MKTIVYDYRIMELKIRHHDGFNMSNREMSIETSKIMKREFNWLRSVTVDETDYKIHHIKLPMNQLDNFFAWANNHDEIEFNYFPYKIPHD